MVPRTCCSRRGSWLNSQYPLGTQPSVTQVPGIGHPHLNSTSTMHTRDAHAYTQATQSPREIIEQMNLLTSPTKGARHGRVYTCHLSTWEVEAQDREFRSSSAT